VHDLDHDGKLTMQEAIALRHTPHRAPPAPVAARPSAVPPPSRTHWKYGYANTIEEAVDEAVLWLVFVATAYQAVRWIVRRLQRHRKPYIPVARLQSDSKILPASSVLDEESSRPARASSHIGGGAELEEVSGGAIVQMHPPPAGLDLEEVCTSVEEGGQTVVHSQVCATQSGAGYPPAANARVVAAQVVPKLAPPSDSAYAAEVPAAALVDADDDAHRL